MSRHLPVRPNFEYLKNEAKELLPQLRRENPDSKLADAQRVLAAEYGFRSWSALKTHRQSLSAASGPPPDDVSPFVGRWTADLSKSMRHPDHPFVRATLEFDVLGDTVTIVDVVIDTAGREERGSNTLQADGQEHPGEYGYMVRATWLGSHQLEVVVKKNGAVEGRVHYQVSPDADTLTLSTDRLVGVFDRQ